MSTHTLPGLVDVHVHLRRPGGTRKETVASGTAAALAGGFTAVLAMPNTEPPITTAHRMAAARAEYAQAARCDVGLYFAAAADNAEEARVAARVACGLKIYVNATFGPLLVDDPLALRSQYESWPGPGPIVVHAEGPAVATAIGLARRFGRRTHLAHVSTAADIRLVAAAKEQGLPVTCEVTPHHLFLASDDGALLGGRGVVRPPLATAADRQALWSHLDVVDCIATDHAPHSRDEKAAPRPPAGMPGLETALPVLLSAVYEDRLSLERLVELTSRRPSEIFGVTTPMESTVEVEIGPPWRLPERGYQSLCDWSAFAGREVRGRVRRVRLRGRLVCDDGAVTAPEGWGRLIPPDPGSSVRGA